MTPFQKQVCRAVYRVWMSGHKYYRASSSGERVTLASLYRHGALDRRCWRGSDGAANAAYEYRPSDQLLNVVRTNNVK